MGTNYYCHIIPSKKRKKELTDAIKADNFDLVKKLTHEMYGPIEKDWDSDEITGGVVHLGKMSYGWKFLWNPNVYVVRHGHSEKTENKDGSTSYKWITEPNTALYLYPLTKEGIKAFIDMDEVLIYDEYGELQDKDAFFEEAINHTKWKDREAYDADSYYKDHPMDHTWTHTSELTDLLEAEGFKLSVYKVDFYSDGLRFSTSTEFS